MVVQTPADKRPQMRGLRSDSDQRVDVVLVALVNVQQQREGCIQYDVGGADQSGRKEKNQVSCFRAWRCSALFAP